MISNPGEVARRIVSVIESDILGRRGLRDALESVDDYAREEIRQHWEALICAQIKDYAK